MRQGRRHAVIYSFDAAGNRLTLTKIVGDSTNRTRYAYDVLNRLTNMVSGVTATAYNYDLNGSRIEKVATTTGAVVRTTYQYDTANRLIAAGDGSNTIFAAAYDYRPRRSSTTEAGVTKAFRYDSGDSFQEVVAEGGDCGVVQVEFVRGSGLGGGIGSILYRSTLDPQPSTEVFTYNAVGHTVALTGDSGVGVPPAILKAGYYEAYGNIGSGTGQNANNRPSNTKERSFALELDNHGFRYYDPEWAATSPATPSVTATG